jgi:putative ABC transport system permease protein
MRTAYRKVLRDLWHNKGRTFLVVMSIAAGVLAVGMITAGNQTLARQILSAHHASNPSHAWLYLNGTVDESTVASLSRLPQVAAIEGFTEISMQWKADLAADWQDASLIAVADYQDQAFDVITLKTGTWPGKKTIAVEFNHPNPYGIPGLGGTVYVEVNGRPRPVEVVGLVRDPFQFPPPFGIRPAFYVTQEEMVKLTGFSGYDTLRFAVTDYSETHVETVADEIDQKLQKQGLSVGFVQVLHPDRHFVQDTIDGVGLVLTVMAVASLGLSTFLVINTVNALISQQVPQIGIMKAVGGIRGQIARLYLSGVIVYGVLSLGLAVPLGAIGGDIISRWMLGLLNVPAASFEVRSTSLAYQLLTGLLTPLLAALYPVLKGVQVAVARALSMYGLGTGRYGSGWLDKLLGRVRGLPRLTALSLRNTFRRPGRVSLTMVTLTAAGAIFMLVISTHHSFDFTIEKIFRGFGFDVLLGFVEPQRVDTIVPVLESRPGVERAEMWHFIGGEARGPESAEPEAVYEIFLRGVPRDSELFAPELVAGRRLDQEDGHALLLNQKLARRMGVGIGDPLIVDMGGSETSWTVVGLIFDMSGRDQDTGYVHADILSREMNLVGRSAVAEIKGETETLAAQQAIEKDLREYFEAQGIGISFTDTALENREQSNAQINILTTILLVMTILIAFVGSIGLSGMLSINVFERRREVGVMRAVGASSWDVYRVFITEGLLLGIISWAQAVPLSLLFGPIFVQAIGEVIDFPAVYDPSIQGIWGWLGIVIVLSIVASWLPARRATGISVNESLAYE